MSLSRKNVLNDASHLPFSALLRPRVSPNGVLRSKQEEPAAEPPVEVTELTAMELVKASLGTTWDVLSVQDIVKYFVNGTDRELADAVHAIEAAAR